MIVFFPIVLGLASGWLRGGSLANLAALRVRCALLPLAAVGLQMWFVVFSQGAPGVPAGVRVGVLLATYSGLIGFLVLNRRLPGAAILLLGAGLNAAVMAANGGYMPITREALARSGHEGQIVRQGEAQFVFGGKDIVLEADETRLAFLSDIFGIPEELPFSSTFSLGDVLIGVGGCVLIARGMSLQASGIRHQGRSPALSPPALSGAKRSRSVEVRIRGIPEAGVPCLKSQDASVPSRDP